MIRIKQSSRPALVPRRGCDWADTAILNPAIIADPVVPGANPQTGELHMLFRSTGPYPEKRIPGKSMPYPIFLGYASSRDRGRTWKPDFSHAALAPKLEYRPGRILVTDHRGRRVTDYTNGCIEDPRLFYIDDELYLTAACRMFPPGPFWQKDDPQQCLPEWVLNDDHDYGIAATGNLTVSVLYRVDLAKLRRRDYKKSFIYITHLTDPNLSDNRDVFFFSRKLTINGKKQYVMLHRPHHGENFPGGRKTMRPSIWLSAASRFEDFTTSRARHRLLVQPLFDWETDKIGASWPPLDLGNGEWLLPYHGKKDVRTGYTQSFMILKEDNKQWFRILHRCPDRLMYAKHRWERKGLLPAPCVFTTAGLVIDGTLLMGYGAADMNVGMASVNYTRLLDHIRRYDSRGRKRNSLNT